MRVWDNLACANTTAGPYGLTTLRRRLGGSPVSAAGRAVLTAAIAVLLAVGAYLGTVPLLAISVVLVLAFAYGWPTLLGLPWLWGSRVVIALAGIGAVIAGTISDGDVGGLAFIVAIGVILAFVSEMLRRDGRARLVESLCGAVGGVVGVVCVGGWLAAANSVQGTALVVTAAACLAAAAAVSVAVPLPDVLNAILTTVAAGAAGVGISALLPHIGASQGLWAGLVAGVLVAAFHVLFDRLIDIRRPTVAIAAAVVPVLVGGMLIYIVGTIVITV